jgi:hypothetical protein
MYAVLYLCDGLPCPALEPWDCFTGLRCLACRDRRAAWDLYRYFARYLGRFGCEKVRFGGCAAVVLTVRQAGLGAGAAVVRQM